MTTASSTTAGLAGLTRAECAHGCSAAGCVITASGSGICAHPAKSGLQYADKKPDILVIYAEACKMAGTKNIHELSQ